MRFKAEAQSRPIVNRRAFLRAAGGVAVGLPFLEGLPERSAWAATAKPTFTLLIVAQNGVVNNKFFPATTGSLTAAGLAGATDMATSVLSAHAPNLLFIKGLNYPNPGPKSCGHAEGNVQTLTGLAPGSTGNTSYAAGPSADTLIAKALGSGDPLALYSGSKGFIAERISFKAAGAGQVRSADVNPYLLYSKVVGLTSATPTPAPTGGMTTPTVDPVAQELIATRKSVNDLVRGEMKSLMNMSVLSSADKQRLQQHFDAIRDVENTMGGMATTAAGVSCTKGTLPTAEYDALKSGFAFKGTMMEDYVRLHLKIMAVAFGCNYNRVATLQWGDGTDGTKYSVKSNEGLGWTFHQLSHRIQSDSASGSNPTAEAAHHEIDIVRMKTLAAGLDSFKEYGLQDNAMVVWTNSIADGPSHSTRGVPMIVWGSGGGYLKQGAYLDSAGTANAKVLNTIMAAATQGAASVPAIGSGTYDAIKA